MKFLAPIVLSACMLAAGCATYESRTVVEKPVPAVAPTAAVVPAPAGSTVVYTAPAR